MNQLSNADLHSANRKLKKHVLPPLKYDYASLASCIDSRTIIVHHNNHHASYVKKLNEALEMYPEFHDCSAF